MTKHIASKDMTVVGIDLAKSSFHVHGIDDEGGVRVSKKVSRKQLAIMMANLPSCLVGMEACGGAHYWARKLRGFGHQVKLIAPQFVKPYVKSNKNDRVDAEAICEAVTRSNMRFVAVKEIEQQDIQSIHRVRSHAVAQRTAQVNQVRGLLMEYGIVLAQGRAQVRKQLPWILEDAENGLSLRLRSLLSGIYAELIHLDERIANLDQEIEQIAVSDERCRRLLTIPGVGPITATALIAAIGDIETFKNGRELAAWLGLVPRQYSTGGKDRLLGISKRGDVYVRQLLIHGARSVLRFVDKKTDTRSRWAQSLIQRRNKNIVAVAMANKMARTVYALLKYEQDYQASPVAA